MLNKVNMVFMSCGNGVGFEIFEFQDPKYEKSRDFNTGFQQGGFFHIAVTVPDPGMCKGLCLKYNADSEFVDATVVKATDLGGKQIGETCLMYGEKALYLQDPWGNVVECLSCSFEQLMGNRG